MKQDKAIKKVLEKTQDSLPFGFEEKVMKQILVEEKKKSKRNYFLNLTLISCVSIFMLIGTYFLLKVVYAINIFNLISFDLPFAQNKDSFRFYFYIAVLALALLGIDYALRHFFKKTKHSL